MAPNSRILVVSDFDRTLHDGDADLLVIGDDGQRNMDSATAGNFHWQVYMDERLGELHTEGVTWAHIRERLADSAINPYALRALRRLKRRTACRMICLTSGNAMFTSAMLENAGGGDVFDDVVGQIATLADDGRVRVSPRSPIDKPHGCDLFCYAGMCKSQALRELVDPDTFDRQIFLGDGVNDWCSVRSLKSGDIALVRAGFPLDRLISAGPPPLAIVKRWHDGKELARLLDGLTL